MILGIGLDHVEVPRIARLYQKYGSRFLKKVFSMEEETYSLSRPFPEESLAARFAAKEAFLKALGTGVSQGIHWENVSVRRRPGGAPSLHLSGQALKILKEKKGSQVFLSLSHTKDFALAFVIIEKRDA